MITLHDNLRGSLWMTIAMAFFAAEDAMFKATAETLPLGQVILLFGLGGMIIFYLTAVSRAEPVFTSAILSPVMRWRVGFEICGRLFYFLAITLTPLASATVILQAAPLFVVGGAALFLKETVGWRSWLAIVVGICGVLIILQPGTDAFAPLSILAVLGMLGFAGRDLASRAAPVSISAAVLGFYGFLVLVGVGTAILLWQGTEMIWPKGVTILTMACTICFGTIGYFSLMVAMRTGDVGQIAPFRYTRLIFGVALGVLFFGETLESTTIFGAALIVLSGGFVLVRRRQR